MMPNFLEQLVAEWYEYQGFYVRRNVRVGLLKKGGYQTELDVVAFRPDPDPSKCRLIHVEPSMDADHWDVRVKRYSKKFRVAADYIPTLFKGFGPLPAIDHIALFVFGAVSHKTIGDPVVGRVVLLRDLMGEIRAELGKRGGIAKSVVHEQYVILRALQFAEDYW